MGGFPFSAIVGQDEMKRALLIAAVDASIGGVVIFGDPRSGVTQCDIGAINKYLYF